MVERYPARESLPPEDSRRQGVILPHRFTFTLRQEDNRHAVKPWIPVRGGVGMKLARLRRFR